MWNGRKENDIVAESSDGQDMERPLLSKTMGEEIDNANEKNYGHKMTQLDGDLKTGSDKGQSAITSSDYTIYISEAKHSCSKESDCKATCKHYADKLKEEMKKYLSWVAGYRPFCCPGNIYFNFAFFFIFELIIRVYDRVEFITVSISYL